MKYHIRLSISIKSIVLSSEMCKFTCCFTVLPTPKHLSIPSYTTPITLGNLNGKFASEVASNVVDEVAKSEIASRLTLIRLSTLHTLAVNNLD